VSYVRQVGGRTTSIVNKAYRGCDRGRTTSIAAQLRQTLVNSPPIHVTEAGRQLSYVDREPTAGYTVSLPRRRIQQRAAAAAACCPH